MTHAPPSRAGHAQTVLGLVAPGVARPHAPHEHLFVDLRFLYREAAGGCGAGTDWSRWSRQPLRDQLRLVLEPREPEPRRRDDRHRGGEPVPAGGWPDPRRSPPPSGSARDPLALSDRARDGAPRHHGRGVLHGAVAPAALAGAAEDALVGDRPRRHRGGRRDARPGGADRGDRLLVAVDGDRAQVPARAAASPRAGDGRPAHDPPRPRSEGSRGAPRRGSPRRDSTPAGSL